MITTSCDPFKVKACLLVQSLIESVREQNVEGCLDFWDLSPIPHVNRPIGFAVLLFASDWWFTPV